MHWYKGNKDTHYNGGYAIRTDRTWIVLREFESLLVIAYPLKIYEDKEPHCDLLILTVYNDVLKREMLATFSKRPSE